MPICLEALMFFCSYVLRVSGRFHNLQTKKRHYILTSVLFCAITLHLSRAKWKKHVFHFVLHSVCTNFSFVKLGCGSELKMKVLKLSFCTSLTLH